MNNDMMMLALIGIADVALLVHLRRRRASRKRLERVMDALRLAIRRANSVDVMPKKFQLRRAS